MIFRQKLSKKLQQWLQVGKAERKTFLTFLIPRSIKEGKKERKTSGAHFRHLCTKYINTPRILWLLDLNDVRVSGVNCNAHGSDDKSTHCSTKFMGVMWWSRSDQPTETEDTNKTRHDTTQQRNCFPGSIPLCFFTTINHTLRHKTTEIETRSVLNTSVCAFVCRKEVTLRQDGLIDKFPSSIRMSQP